MKNRRGFTVIQLLIVILLVFGLYGWGSNLYKFASCDFEAPYKAEIIHGIGLVPVVGIFTGYMDFGK